ncbi:MAG: methylmalonyl Co-A mutase-associated GTPase MeaB, partial [bacterium]|nr:methylmalonyl Co-A mutase-associated GTPase MeaB [bacterium]
ESLAAGIIQGVRRDIAKAITLVESKSSRDQELSVKLIEKILPKTGKSIRIGISGPPGVGKSTLIEALGLRLIGKGKKIAVLAVDPSSVLTFGSILGDKTRMPNLSINSQAFVRPSPSSGILGGVTDSTRESILICEAAGFDIIIVETVGVGQSEFNVAQMVDTFIVLLQPFAGDELQGVKKGILEMVDVVVINKCDGELKEQAMKCCVDYTHALSLIKQNDKTKWVVPVLKVSALQQEGLSDLWLKIVEHTAFLKQINKKKSKRIAQDEQWFWEIVTKNLIAEIKQDKSKQYVLKTILAQINDRKISVLQVAKQFIHHSCD